MFALFHEECNQANHYADEGVADPSHQLGFFRVTSLNEELRLHHIEVETLLDLEALVEPGIDLQRLSRIHVHRHAVLRDFLVLEQRFSHLINF